MELITKDKFVEVTKLVIDNLEGGYYHPDMKKSFNERSQKAFGDSGETMFGIDRKHGVQLAKYPEWDLFWGTVDAAKTKEPAGFGYNKRGGKYEITLKDYCASLMFQWFTYLSNKYLKPESLQAIANDDRLLMHMSYASWNGEGFFKTFAAALQKAAIDYAGNKEVIFEEALKARTQSPKPVIRQQAVNLFALYRKEGMVG